MTDEKKNEDVVEDCIEERDEAPSDAERAELIANGLMPYSFEVTHNPEGDLWNLALSMDISPDTGKFLVSKVAPSEVRSLAVIIGIGNHQFVMTNTWGTSNPANILRAIADGMDRAIRPAGKEKELADALAEEPEVQEALSALANLLKG